MVREDQPYLKGENHSRAFHNTSDAICSAQRTQTETKPTQGNDKCTNPRESSSSPRSAAELVMLIDRAVSGSFFYNAVTMLR